MSVDDDSPAIRVRGLRKSYGGAEAVAGIDFDVPRGQIFALLGPNGAGKTTTVEILEGFRSRDSGQVRVLGCDPGSQRARLKPRIGIVLQSTGVEPYLTVRETVTMYADVYPHPRPVPDVLALVELTDKADSRVNRLSGGQQRRLDMAVALAGDPDLLFLDEPTTGFDPAARREAWETVRALARLGKTVLLTTHYMDEAQYLADRVAVIVAGRIVAEGPPATLGLRDQAHARIRFALDARHQAGLPPELAAARTDAGDYSIEVDDPVPALHRLTGWALERGVRLDALEVVRPSLEDVYLQLTTENATE